MFCFCKACSREAIDIMWRSNENTIEGRGRTLRRNHFSDGVVRERDGGRERCLLLGKEHETPSPRRSRWPTAKDVTMQANSYRASFRSIKMFYLTHDLEGLDVDFFLHKNKVLHSDVVGVLGHRLGETGTMEQLYSSNAFFSSTLNYNTLQAGVAGVFSALHHMCKAWCKQKKSVGSWFDAESASPLGGELSFTFTI